ncbi:hypothetical protein QE80_002345 [Salmonella enterica subsp. enterica]|nr:hypothetical protein [Salmonella enterica subsp. enterica]EDV4378064.1 hypothetical protein [Salmonella enterica subsp. enterica]
MVTKSKIHCRRISGKLLFQHPDRLFRQISAISKLSEYLSVSSGEKPVLIHLVKNLFLFIWFHLMICSHFFTAILQGEFQCLL